MELYIQITYVDIEDFEQIGFEIISNNSAPFYIGFELFTYFIKRVLNLLDSQKNELSSHETVFLTEDEEELILLIFRQNSVEILTAGVSDNFDYSYTKNREAFKFCSVPIEIFSKIDIFSKLELQTNIFIKMILFIFEVYFLDWKIYAIKENDDIDDMTILISRYNEIKEKLNYPDTDCNKQDIITIERQIYDEQTDTDNPIGTTRYKC